MPKVGKGKARARDVGILERWMTMQKEPKCRSKLLLAIIGRIEYA